MAQNAKSAPDPIEKKAIDNAVLRVAARQPRVKVVFKQNAENKVELQGANHNDHEGWIARIVDAFGTRGTEFALSQLNQIMSACREGDGKIDQARVNAMLSMVEAARPENEIQAALAVQMAVTHYATLTLMGRALRVDQISQFDSAGSMTVKLARTFALQVEALAKLQRGGQQVVKVVHVYAGGQAIVGNVSTAANGSAGANGATSEVRDREGVHLENSNQPHTKGELPAPAAQPMPPLWSKDSEREPVSVAVGRR